MFKLGWKFFSGANDYWCTVMRGKYAHYEARPCDSSLWKVLAGMKTEVWSNCRWIEGDGCDIEAWNHAWIEEGLSISQHVTIPQELISARVGSYVKLNTDGACKEGRVAGVMELLEEVKVNGLDWSQEDLTVTEHVDWNVKVMHEYREANKCADALANMGCELDKEMVFYEECLMEIREILLADELGNS
ncbi:ethylene responsive transcription factor 1b [Trifolium pratense]|uniref:Ethylene responsive transcription factor 1b n=1 Tax=Trifolium pratense TaxID=57577 RepID=A0A2K3M8U1_TRIPR|nr:ethylene responsive transcription factor 1b [Trifolium pratense]